MHTKTQRERDADKIQTVCRTWLYCSNCPCYSKKIGCIFKKARYGFSSDEWKESDSNDG